MNREKFLQKVSKLGAGMEVDAHRMPKWFEESLKALEAFGKQKEGVKHPGHRGTSRENPLQGLLDRMLPATVSVEKGFAVNRWMAESKEQDLLVVDGNISGRLFPEEDYFPIESCLASIQVKSNLTRAEIRKADGQLREHQAVVRMAFGRGGEERRRLRHAVLHRVLLREQLGTRAAGAGR